MTTNDSENLGIVCRVCALINSSSSVRCSECWADLRNYEAVDEATQLEIANKIKRRRFLERLVRKTIKATVVMAITMWWILSVFEFGIPPSPSMPQISAQTIGADWALPRKDFQNSGYSESNLNFQINQQEHTPNEIIWSFDTDKPLLTTPIVVGDRVFLGSGDARMVALDRTDGTLVWEFPTTGPIHSTPTFAENHIYFGLLDGRVIALDSDTGGLIWEYETANPVLGSILVKNGTAYVGSGDHTLYALDAATGEELWTWQTSGWITSTPVLLEDDILAVASMDGFVYFLDMHTGRKRLTYDSTLAIHGSPTALGNQTIVGNQRGYVFSLDATKLEYPGERFWRTFRTYMWLYFKIGSVPEAQKGTQWVYSTRGQIYTEPAIANNLVYVSATNVLTRRNLPNFVSLPESSNPNQEDTSLTTLALQFTNTSETPQIGGALLCLDAITGELQWKTAAASDFPTSPVVVGDYVLIGNSNGVLQAFEATSGELIWSYTTEGAINSPPSIVDNELYLNSGDGSLYKIKSREVVWN